MSIVGKLVFFHHFFCNHTILAIFHVLEKIPSSRHLLNRFVSGVGVCSKRIFLNSLGILSVVVAFLFFIADRVRSISHRVNRWSCLNVSLGCIVPYVSMIVLACVSAG